MNEKTERSVRYFDSMFLGMRSDSPSHHDMEDISKEPSDLGGGPRWIGYNDIDPKKTEKLTEHQRFLLPQHTLGFMLDTKEWSLSMLVPLGSSSLSFFLGILDIDCIDDLPETTGFMANLLLPAQGNHRTIIQAVLNKHSSSPADFVDRKGQSRVVLLHGESTPQYKYRH